MLTLKQINDKTVKKIFLPEEDTRPIKGFAVCPEVYSNIFLCAKKKSGKTSALFKILKECSGKKTIIVVFCSTVYKDANWIQIRKYFENKGIEIRVYTSIFEDGIDQLALLIDELNEDARQKEEEDKTTDEPELDKCDSILERLGKPHDALLEQEENKDKKRKPKKTKYQYPEYIIVFDDLSTELKSKSLLALMKKNRHYKCKLILSSQYVNDILPASRKQLDLWMIFKGFPEKKMQEIYRDTDSGLPFETFYNIYKKATKKPFSFMFIDTRSDSYRRNFDQQFIIKMDDEETDEL